MRFCFFFTRSDIGGWFWICEEDQMNQPGPGSAKACCCTRRKTRTDVGRTCKTHTERPEMKVLLRATIILHYTQCQGTLFFFFYHLALKRNLHRGLIVFLPLVQSTNWHIKQFQVLHQTRWCRFGKKINHQRGRTSTCMCKCICGTYIYTEWGGGTWEITFKSIGQHHLCSSEVIITLTSDVKIWVYKTCQFYWCSEQTGLNCWLNHADLNEISQPTELLRKLCS